MHKKNVQRMMFFSMLLAGFIDCPQAARGIILISPKILWSFPACKIDFKANIALPSTIFFRHINPLVPHGEITSG